ncbi:hypothetical protein [Cupriavidus sp. GA3-3]|uniref:hypothetical protein n=1 Tax=Cupriavidus sp. GA3-3 TaxID=1229514 RepID=UPI001AEFDA12|nr:hypothetical protein [Cupriavidus sp. GA3-3]
MINIIPMLLASLVVVTALQQAGAIQWLETILTPVLSHLDIDPAFTLPSLTKYLAGSTALVGVVHDMAVRHILPAAVTTAGGAGFLLHPLDLPGVAILLSAGTRIGKNAMPAIAGACVGIVLRTVLGACLG